MTRPPEDEADKAVYLSVTPVLTHGEHESQAVGSTADQTDPMPRSASSSSDAEGTETSEKTKRAPGVSFTDLLKSSNGAADRPVSSPGSIARTLVRNTVSETDSNVAVRRAEVLAPEWGAHAVIEPPKLWEKGNTDTDEIMVGERPTKESLPDPAEYVRNTVVKVASTVGFDDSVRAEQEEEHVRESGKEENDTVDEVTDTRDRAEPITTAGNEAREWVQEDTVLRDERDEVVEKEEERQEAVCDAVCKDLNPVFASHERIIDERNDNQMEYLMKHAGLDLKYSTWERECDESLIDAYETLKVAEPVIKKPHEFDINDTFSLDVAQQGVVKELYEMVLSADESTHMGVTLSGNVGSIMRLEVSALFHVLKGNNNCFGPFLLVVDSSILDMAVYELVTYTELVILKVPGGDADEFDFIKHYGFAFADGKPKFHVAVVADTAFQRFADELRMKFVVAVVDGSEMYGDIPSVHLVDSGFGMLMLRRDSNSEETILDSMDDVTRLHTELTLFCPMVESQRELYGSMVMENIDMLTGKQSDVDKSRLYDIVTNLSAVANFPSIRNIQDFVILGNSGGLKKKTFSDCGKMRVVTKMIEWAHNKDKRLMIMCREALLMDTLELYCATHDISFGRMGLLSAKRLRLEDFSQEAKSDKSVIVLSQFETRAVNWLSVKADAIIVFDGCYNPMYYFSSQQKRARNLKCPVVRLLSADSHEVFLGACADHYHEDDPPLYDTFRAAAFSFLRPNKSAELLTGEFQPTAGFSALFGGDEDGSSDGYDMESERDEDDKSASDELESKETSHGLSSRDEARLKSRLRRRVERNPKGDSPGPRKSGRGRGRKAEVPTESAEKSEITEFDNNYIWSKSEISTMFIAMTHIAWGQWTRFRPFCRAKCSIPAIQECCYRILACAVCPGCDDIFTRILNEYRFVLPDTCASNVRTSVSSELPSVIEYRLQRIAYMIGVAVVISRSADPPVDFVITASPATIPGFSWTEDDDKRLIWSVWEYGRAVFALGSDYWTIPCTSLCRRFEALIDSMKAEGPLFPRELDVPRVRPTGKVSQNFKDVVMSFGVTDLREMAGRAGCWIDTARVELEPSLFDKDSLRHIELFDRIRHELEFHRDHFSEDLQFLESLAYHGLEHASDSRVITTVMRVSMPTAASLKRRGENIMCERLGDLMEQCATRDSIGGLRPILPLEICDGQRVVDLGVVSDKDGFSDECYIYPVGFTSEITFPSLDQHGKEAIYSCTILEVEGAPVFRVAVSGNFYEQSTADAVWTEVMDLVSAFQRVVLFDGVRAPGHELFGLASPLTLRLIQALPNAQLCEKYVMRAFKTPYIALQKRNLLTE